MVSTQLHSDIAGPAFAGGLMIGAAALLLYLTIGRIAGVSGILFGALTETHRERYWRLCFLAGLVAGGWLAVASGLSTVSASTGGASLLLLAAGGLAIGYGTRLGSGCTSGHGVCGLGRLSPRSLTAVAVFMATGFLTATWLRPWLLALIHA